MPTNTIPEIPAAPGESLAAFKCDAAFWHGLLAMACLFALSLPALAHHSFRSQYDADRPVTFTGIVTKIEWMNPHVYFYIDVDNEETGALENWGFEMGPPHMLQRRGWKRNSMQIGDEVEVHGTRARDGSTTANARRVTLTSTGEVLGAASSESQTITSGEQPAN